MKETRTNGSRSALQPATAGNRGLGYFRLGSEQSRAAARALVIARNEGNSEGELGQTAGLYRACERLEAARKRSESGGNGCAVETDPHPTWERKHGTRTIGSPHQFSAGENEGK